MNLAPLFDFRLDRFLGRQALGIVYGVLLVIHLIAGVLGLVVLLSGNLLGLLVLVGALVGAVVLRVAFEFLAVVFRASDDIRAIREQAEARTIPGQI